MTSSKQAEKEYLARAGSGEWEREKPFSPRGADTIVDSAQLLHDFAVAALILQPAVDDLILDLGAGGCWCSDLFRRLNRRSVAVDISHDMLRVGRSRPGGAAIPAVAGDLEQLPFRSASFTKALSLSAIHHVPDIPRALAEIARVLTDDGVALFLEPGKGHADAPVSTAAMKDFGVLDQEILVTDFTRACADAGFRDVRIKPLSYAIPDFDQTPEEWREWTRLARSKRPVRALGKLGRALAELVGAGKRRVLLEEALGMSIVRIFRHAMEDHPILLASKAPLEAARRGSWSARIEVRSMPTRGRAAGTLPIVVRLANTGSRPWTQSSGRGGAGDVRLGVQLFDEHAKLLARDHHRVALPRAVRPREVVDLRFECPLPAAPGRYQLKFDLVAEGVTWFEQKGSPAVEQPLVVEPG